MTDTTTSPGTPSSDATDLLAVVDFWRDAGPKRWFKKDETFDQSFRERFLARHNASARGEHDAAAATAEGALALLLLLDQFPRNAFRDSARAFATDGQARDIAAGAIARGADLQVEPDLQAFFYMPFMHSETLAHQQRSVELCRRLGGETLRFAEMHRDIIERFGRFPHRNTLLGRSTTDEEQSFLDTGGFAG